MARGGWSRSPAGFAKIIEADLTDMVKEITLEAFGMIIRLSPVDTGAFRANNRLSVGGADDSYSEAETGMANQAEARATIQALRVPFTTIYITNSLPYAVALEEGGSQQAPAGVYAVTANNLRERYSR